MSGTTQVRYRKCWTVAQDGALAAYDRQYRKPLLSLVGAGGHQSVACCKLHVTAHFRDSSSSTGILTVCRLWAWHQIVAVQENTQPVLNTWPRPWPFWALSSNSVCLDTGHRRQSSHLHTKFEGCSFSCSRDMERVPKFKSRSRDLGHAPFVL